MEQAQANNLAFLEAWLGGLPQVAGVPVVKSLTYEMIQIVNRAWLQEQQGENIE